MTIATRKRLLALLAGMMLTTTAVQAEDKPLRIAAPFEIKGTDPALSGDIFLKMDIVETLTGADSNGAPVPALASAWQVSDDGLHWQFTLRENVHFHDGSPLDARSVVKSLLAAKARPGLLDKAPIAAIHGEGQHVTIDLREPFAPLLSVLAENRSQILALASWDAQDRIHTIIGTGPFRLTRLQPPQKLDVERFDGYWGDKPAISRASYLAASRAETRAILADSNGADYVLNLDPASKRRLAQKKSLSVLEAPIPRMVMLKVNAGHPFLKDVATRQALSEAINREAIGSAVLRYPAQATQLFPPAVGAWHNSSLTPLTWQPEQAKKQLAAAGWTPGPDGILQRDGQRFALTLTTYPDRPELPLIAMVIQQQLRQIGIDITLNSTNSSEIPVKHHDNTLELALIARNFALTPDPTGTLLQDYAPQGGDWGSMNWHNAEFDKALHQLTLADSPESRATLTRILQQELPVIPVAWYQQTAAVSKKLEGVTLDPFERSFGLRHIRWTQP